MKNTFLKTLFAIMSFIPLTSIAQTTHNVIAGNYYFSTVNETIYVGDEVCWFNEDGYHDVNFAGYGNPQDLVDQYLPPNSGGNLGCVTFNTSGSFNYDCSIGSHAAMGMVSSITVQPNQSTTVVDVVVNSENHTTLEAAVVAAGLVETLSGDGPFTVFAPTDSAFALLPEGLIAQLLEDPSGDLTTILTHHVHSGNVLSTDLSNGMMVPTLAGTELTVSIMDSTVLIDNANVIVADIETDNGVVHVIDAVLVPSDLNIYDLNILPSQDYYLYSIDIMGRKINNVLSHQIIFDVYSSGKVIKRYSTINY